MANDGYPVVRPLSAGQVRARLEAQTIPTTLTNGLIATCDSVAVATYGGAIWNVAAKKSDGTRYVATIRAKLNAAGSDAEYEETGGDDGGGLQVAFTVDVSAGLMRLRALASAVGWTVYSWRQTTLFA